MSDDENKTEESAWIYFAYLRVIQARIDVIAEKNFFESKGKPWTGSHSGQKREHDAEICFNDAYITIDPTTAELLGGVDDPVEFSKDWVNVIHKLKEGAIRYPAPSCD